MTFLDKHSVNIKVPPKIKSREIYHPSIHQPSITWASQIRLSTINRINAGVRCNLFRREKWSGVLVALCRTFNLVPLLTRVSPNRKEAISSISVQFHHMPEWYERVHVGWHCAKVKRHAELKIEKPRVKTLSYDFPELPHSTVSVLTYTYAKLKQTVMVIERSRDVTPRSKYGKVKGHPRSSCAPNMVQFRLIFTELRHFENNGACHFSLIVFIFGFALRKL